jgi:hypothetical protein
MIKVVVDAKKLEAFITRVETNLPKISKAVTKQMAEIFKEKVKESLNSHSRGSTQSSGHNTPSHLISLLHTQGTDNGKGKIGQLVWFDSAGGFDLAKAVELGTKPHLQPNNFRIRDREGNKHIHPGTQPLFFWRDATQSFIENDADFWVKKTADEWIR